MKVERIDRIYVYVKDLEKARRLFGDLLETEFSEPMSYKDADMTCSYSPLGLTLAEPLSPDGFVAKIIKNRGEGVAMVALKVKNLKEATAEMESRGIRRIGGFEMGGYKAITYHPKDAFGVLLDLSEFKDKHPIVDALRKK